MEPMINQWMRPLEICLVALAVSGAYCIATERRQRILNLLVLTAGLVVLVHVFFEGVRWQLVPVYAALGVCGLGAWAKLREGSTARFALASGPLVLVASSMSLCAVLPMFQLPRPTGTYSVGTSTVYMKDPSRTEDETEGSSSPRELMVQLWYPSRESHSSVARYRELREANFISSYQSLIETNSRLNAPIAATGKPYPVILLNPSWRGRRTNYTFLAEELASHGYFVAAIDHTYNASRVAFPDGRVVLSKAALDIVVPDSSTSERVMNIWNTELVKWVGDEEFVLNQLDTMNRSSSSRWHGLLDIQKVGAIGHSFGGAAATLFCAEDRRVLASVNMDGWFFNAIRKRGANQPLMAMDADSGAAVGKSGPEDDVESTLDARDSHDVEDSLQKWGGYQMEVRGASHEDFSDQPLVSPLPQLAHRGSVSAGRIHSMVRAYVLAFFDKTLRNQDSKLLEGASGPYAEVSVKIWPLKAIGPGASGPIGN